MPTTPGKRTAKLRTTLTRQVIDALQPTDKSWIAWDDTLTGFGVCIRPGGAKSFIVNYRAGDSGRKAPNKRVVIGRCDKTTPEQARRLARIILGQAAGGADPIYERVAACHVLARGRQRSRSVGPELFGRSAADYSNQIPEQPRGNRIPGPLRAHHEPLPRHGRWPALLPPGQPRALRARRARRVGDRIEKDLDLGRRSGVTPWFLDPQRTRRRSADWRIPPRAARLARRKLRFRPDPPRQRSPRMSPRQPAPNSSAGTAMPVRFPA